MAGIKVQLWEADRRKSSAEIWLVEFICGPFLQTVIRMHVHKNICVVPPLAMKCFCVNCYILYSMYLFVLDNHEMSSLRGSADIPERISPREQQAVPNKEQLSISYILKLLGQLFSH